DDASAFNGEKIEQLDRKGKVNNRFNAFIMEKLAEAGILPPALLIALTTSLGSFFTCLFAYTIFDKESVKGKISL
ncbi:phosphoribosylaminoimidazolesuccinocarboxamide synthase, partial [Acinetobacter baumannii]|nr:phosphoribosylaminoimidazolesuccinocarboxamide synthase [Acinetobacter baumannii]